MSTKDDILNRWQQDSPLAQQQQAFNEMSRFKELGRQGQSNQQYRVMGHHTHHFVEGMDLDGSSLRGQLLGLRAGGVIRDTHNGLQAAAQISTKSYLAAIETEHQKLQAETDKWLEDIK